MSVVQRVRAAQPQTHLTGTFLGCLTAMTKGNLSSITGDHWYNALRSGGFTAAIATVLAVIGIRMSQWTRAILCGASTFTVEMVAQSPTYGTSRADIAQTSLVAAAIAAGLALIAGRMFEKVL